MPGFRKGKAPRSLIEKMYGADVFTYDAINELFPAAYEAAVKEAGIEPLAVPRFLWMLPARPRRDPDR